MKSDYQKIFGIVTLTTFIFLEVFSPAVTFGQENQIETTPPATVSPEETPEPQESTTVPDADTVLENEPEEEVKEKAPDATQEEEAEEEEDPEEETGSLMGGTVEGSGESVGDTFGKNFVSDQLLVSPQDGSLMFSYPLTIPPGRKGVQPDVRLTYNSNVVEELDLLGHGWSVSIPTIRRLNKTGTQNLYTDNAFYSSLSGELVRVGSTTEYRAKVDDGDFLKYEYDNDAWTITDKSGMLFKLGTATTSRQDNAATTTEIYRWLVDKVQDTNGNFVTYNYYKESNQIYPDSITYTNDATSTGIFRIEFERESRDDVRVSYVPRFRVENKYRISEIEVFSENSLVREYNFDYSTGDNENRLLLSSVTESGVGNSGTVSLLPTAFGYSTSTDEWVEDTSRDFPDTIIKSNDDLGVRFADVNGDGLVDVVRSHKEVGFPGTESKSVYINTGDDWVLDTGWTIPEFFAYQSDTGTQLVDVNGDGLADIFRSYKEVGYPGTEYKNVYINNGTGWTLDTSWTIPEFFIIGSTDQGARLADVNGDGLVDIIRSYKEVGYPGTEYENIYINSGTGWTLDTTWSTPEFFVLGSNDQGVRIMDANGDGLADIVRSYKEAGFPGTEYKNVYLNTGNSWTLSASSTIPEFFNVGSTDLGVRIADLNGDGLDDLIRSYKEVGYPGTEYKTAYLNTGTEWVEDTSWTIPDFFIVGSADQGVRLVDANGDGSLDFIANRMEYTGAMLADEIYIHEGKASDYLSDIELSYGGTVAIKYKGSPIYRDGSNNSLNPNLPIFLQTVATTTYNSQLGTIWSNKYSYEGGDYYFASTSIRDRKFAGFNKIIKQNDEGHKTVTYYHQGNSSDSAHGEYDDHISKAGKAYRTEVYDENNNLFAKAITKWDYSNIGSNHNLLMKIQEVASDYDGDSDHKDKAESYAYATSSGNITSKTQWGEVTGSDNGTFSDTGTDKLVTAISYASSSSMYLPSQEVTTDYGSAKVSESKYYYDGLSLGSLSKGNLTKKEERKTASAFIDYEKSYNSYGLVYSEKDPRDKVTSYTFDTYNLYPATSTNPLSQNTAFLYDYSAGKPKQVKDSNGLIFQTTFDGFDRVLEEKQPEIASPTTLVTKTEYQYTDNIIPTKVKKIDYLSSATSTDLYSYADGFGRQIQTRKEAEGTNTYAVKDVVYNNLGLVDKESLPYFASSTANTSPTGTASLYTSYTYDPIGRPLTVANNLGATTNVYDDWKFTITDSDSKVKDIYKDAYGRISSVVEHISTTTPTTAYEYNGLGNLTKITDAEGNIRNFTYDYLGRRLTAQDLHNPSDATFGTWTFTYDDTGNLTSQYDPNSQLVNYTYDDLNRMLTEDYTGSGGTDVMLGYDNCAYGIGRLCFATSTLTTQSVGKYAYNALGLRNSETKILESSTFVTSYGFDRQGNTTAVTHPDGLSVSYNYDAAGLPDSIPPYISSIDYSPTGQPRRIVFQNGVITTNTFDSTKLYRLTNKKSMSGATTLQDLTYTYTPAGDITKIVDASQTNTAKTADYTYDDAHRLSTASTSLAATASTTYSQSFSYSPTGRFLIKSDLGTTTYTYYTAADTGYANPQAMKTAGNSTSTYTYDNNGNQKTGGWFKHFWNHRNNLYVNEPIASQFGVDSNGNVYSYDEADNRVKVAETLNQVLVRSTYYPSTSYASSTNGRIEHYIYLGDTLLATVEKLGATTTTRYVHNDHLGSTGIVTNISGQLDETTDYAPYGSSIIDITTTGHTEKHKFTGHMEDGNVGLTYMGARYYDGKLGRFLSQDSLFLGIGSLQYEKQNDLTIDPQRLNSYSYARNNPLRMVDPDGRDAQDVIAGIANAYATNQVMSAGRFDSSDYHGGNQSHYLVGQTIGDVASAFTAGAEIAAGATIGASGAAVTVGSGGLAAAVSVPAAMVGTGIAAHGVGVLGTSMYNFSEDITKTVREPYKRPSNATSKEQKQSVQGNPCVNCGTKAPKMFADHIVPLVKEYYQTGKINLKNMLSPKAVQPQCPTCSNQQGGTLSNYSKQMKQKLGF